MLKGSERLSLASFAISVSLGGAASQGVAGRVKGFFDFR